MAETRMIRRSLIDSERFNSLSWVQQAFYTRVLLIADDYGCFDARPMMLLANLFPTKLDTMSVRDVQGMVAACDRAGLIKFYSVEAKAYGAILGYGQTTKSRPKFPLPDGWEAVEDVKITKNGVRTVTYRLVIHDAPLSDSQPFDSTRCEPMRTDSLDVVVAEGVDGVVFGDVNHMVAGDSLSHASVAAAPCGEPRQGLAPSPFSDSEGWCEWLALCCEARPSLARLHVLPADVEAAARSAFAAVPLTAEDSELLKAYYAAALGDKSKFYRPMGLAKFFADLPDVLTHAQNWARWKGWQSSAQKARLAELKAQREAQRAREREAAGPALSHDEMSELLRGGLPPAVGGGAPS